MTLLFVFALTPGVARVPYRFSPVTAPPPVTIPPPATAPVAPAGRGHCDDYDDCDDDDDEVASDRLHGDADAAAAYSVILPFISTAAAPTVASPADTFAVAVTPPVPGWGPPAATTPSVPRPLVHLELHCGCCCGGHNDIDDNWQLNHYVSYKYGYCCCCGGGNRDADGASGSPQRTR